MRVGEIAALSVGDVLDADGRVRSQIQLKAEQTKGDAARTVLLNAQAQTELAIYHPINDDLTVYVASDEFEFVTVVYPSRRNHTFQREGHIR